MKEPKKKKNIAGRMLVGSILVGGLALSGFYGADYLRKKDNLIAEQTAIIAEQNSTIDDLTLKNTNLGAQITTIQAQKTALERERDNALETLEIRTQERDAEIELKNAALEEKALLSATLETRTQERDAEIALKNQALEEKATALAEVTRLNEVIISINEEIAELESELADEMLSNSQNRELIEALQADITSLNVLKGELQSDISILNGQISTLEGQITEYENTIFELNGQIFLLNEQIITLGEQITAHENTISEKNIEIEGLNGQIEDLNTNITTLQSKVSSAENVINFITLPEYADPIFFEHQLDITSLNGYLNTYVSDVYYSLLINSVEVPFAGTVLILTSYLTDGTNSITVRPYVSYNNTIYYGQTFSTSIDYVAPVYIQMSIAEALSAENGTLISVTGVVTGKYSSLTTSTRYNTLYLADSTGEMVVYELNSNWTDIQIGDVISAKGDKTIYQNLHEIQHATIENSEEEITTIERISATTYAELIAKIPQRVSFTATVQPFLNDFEVVVSFDNTTLNLRLEDSRVLTSIFEIGKTYNINAHMHSKSPTKTFLVIQSLDDIVEVPELEQLVVPTPLEVNFATQELIIPTVANATGYRVVLNDSVTETVDATATTFALASYNLENNSIIELFALGDGVTYADSEGVQYVLEYKQLAAPTISYDAQTHLLTVTDIDIRAIRDGGYVHITNSINGGFAGSYFVENNQFIIDITNYSNLSFGQEYEFFIGLSAYNWNFASENSNYITFLCDWENEEAKIKLTAPTISYDSQTQIFTFISEKPTGASGQYKIYYSSDGITYNDSLSNFPNLITGSIARRLKSSTITHGTYYFKAMIMSFNDDYDDSDFSNVVQGEYIVSRLEVELNYNESTNALTWTNLGVDGVTFSLKIYYSTGDYLKKLTFDSSVSTTQILDLNLESGIYEFRISAEAGETCYGYINSVITENSTITLQIN